MPKELVEVFGASFWVIRHLSILKWKVDQCQLCFEAAGSHAAKRPRHVRGKLVTILDSDQLPAMADLAESALKLWEVPKDAGLRLIKLSENATYLVEAAGGYRSVLRLHRQGYHSRRAIE